MGCSGQEVEVDDSQDMAAGPSKLPEAKTRANGAREELSAAINAGAGSVAKEITVRPCGCLSYTYSCIAKLFLLNASSAVLACSVWL